MSTKAKPKKRNAPRRTLVIFGVAKLGVVLSLYVFGIHANLHEYVNLLRSPGHRNNGSSKEALESEVAQLRAQIERLSANKNASCENQRASLPSSEAALFTHQHAVCKVLDNSSPMALWARYSPQVLAASRLSTRDPDFLFHDFHAQLLARISPRLPNAIQSIPKNWKTFKHIFDKAYARHMYLQDPTQYPETKPVNILIMGGSVLIGRNCRKLKSDLGMDIQLPLRECTWSFRLQEFINSFFNEQLVRVTPMALGGTNTNIGKMVIDYDLVPNEGRRPDIIINGYATNDMHILTVLEAEGKNTTLGQMVFEMTQDFARIVMQKEPCRPYEPLLVHVDDYLGNEQREILKTFELMQGISLLARYYGFVSVSYANMVRDWVYGDTKETWFSPEGWWLRGKNEMQREIHPGMGMHVVATFMMAYTFLHMSTIYCDIQSWNDEYFVMQSAPYKPKTWDKKVTGKPRPPPDGLPPLLSPELSLEHISERWRTEAENESARYQSVDCEHREEHYARCPFSWVGGTNNMSRNKTYVEEYFDKVREKKDTVWTLSDEGDKLGYVPSRLGDTEYLAFMQIKQPLRSVTFFIMKSYGSRWEGGKIEVQTEVLPADGASDWQVLSHAELVGFHAKNTSEMYAEPILLSRAVGVGESLRLRYKKTGPPETTFKIMGLAVCS